MVRTEKQLSWVSEQHANIRLGPATIADVQSGQRLGGGYRSSQRRLPSRRASGFSAFWLQILPLQLSTTHTQASAFPTPSGVRQKRNHSQAERGPNCCHVTHSAC